MVKGVFTVFSLIICSSPCISWCSLSVFRFNASSPSNAMSILLSLFFSLPARYPMKNSADVPSPWGDPMFVLNALPCWFSSFTNNSTFSYNNATRYISSFFSTFLRSSIIMSLFRCWKLCSYQAWAGLFRSQLSIFGV